MSISKESLRSAFENFREGDARDSVLEVGTGGFGNAPDTTIQFAWADKSHRLQASGNGTGPLQVPPSVSASARKKLKAERRDLQRGLPFDDGEFDWIYCDGVMEHLGTAEAQDRLTQELFRVCRKGCFIATANRWHPLEFHTHRILWHWLPRAWWQPVLRHFGMVARDGEPALRLLSSSELGAMAQALPGAPPFSIGHLRFCLVKAQFFLQIRKGG
ncbi:MAG TPA: class I SAM-dependent methyltransferase [Burkholderiaceae bacterium]